MESGDFTRHYIIIYLSARELVLPPRAWPSALLSSHRQWLQALCNSQFVFPVFFDLVLWKTNLLYSWKVWWGIKFGGLVIGVETAKLKSANIISYVTHNDVMHAVVLLVLSGAPLRGCTCV